MSFAKQLGQAVSQSGFQADVADQAVLDLFLGEGVIDKSRQTAALKEAERQIKIAYREAIGMPWLPLFMILAPMLVKWMGINVPTIIQILWRLLPLVV